MPTTANFTHTLTRIDAVYFAVGTLSTAGTGTLAATSEAARALQTVEMLLGMVVLLAVVSAVVARFMYPRTR